MTIGRTIRRPDRRFRASTDRSHRAKTPHGFAAIQAVPELSHCPSTLGADLGNRKLRPEQEQCYGTIANRLHYPEEFGYDEGRCRARARHLPRNLFCVTNEAVAHVRAHERFPFLPLTNRHYAARALNARVAIVIAPPP